jgi:hypothetical protein
VAKEEPVEQDTVKRSEHGVPRAGRFLPTSLFCAVLAFSGHGWHSFVAELNVFSVVEMTSKVTCEKVSSRVEESISSPQLISLSGCGKMLPLHAEF